MNRTRKPTSTPYPDRYMNPGALLRGAAVYLARHGWIQGDIFGDILYADYPSACTIGAINMCVYGRPILNSDANADDETTDAAFRALRVFAAWIDPDYGTGEYQASAIDIIGGWNDDKDRTLREVLETLHDAADDWADTYHTGGAR